MHSSLGDSQNFESSLFEEQSSHSLPLGTLRAIDARLRAAIKVGLNYQKDIILLSTIELSPKITTTDAA
jgi:hypothetical protein